MRRDKADGARRVPRYFEMAQELYGSAFGGRGLLEVEQGMTRWVQLGAAEQTFGLGQLLYLGLRSQVATQRLLGELVAGMRGLSRQLEDMSALGEASGEASPSRVEEDDFNWDDVVDAVMPPDEPAAEARPAEGGESASSSGEVKP